MSDIYAAERKAITILVFILKCDDPDFIDDYVYKTYADKYIKNVPYKIVEKIIKKHPAKERLVNIVKTLNDLEDSEYYVKYDHFNEDLDVAEAAFGLPVGIISFLEY